jgi:hypothetical protein
LEVGQGLIDLLASHKLLFVLCRTSCQLVLRVVKEACQLHQHH